MPLKAVVSKEGDMAKKKEPVVKDNKDKKPVRIPEHRAAPHNPNNIHLKKEDFVKQEKARKEKEAKVATYRKSLDEQEAGKPIDDVKPAPEKGGSTKKPKNIE